MSSEGLKVVADRMQMATGWSEERKQRECDALRAFYEML
jgi:hypothetical protein